VPHHAIRPATDPTPALLVALSGLRFVLFPIPIVTMFWMGPLGMSFTDVMWLQAIFGATVAVLEFPSGYLADRVGHRVALIAGAVCMTAGWIAYARAGGFAGVVLAEVVLATGYACISGADSALLYRALAAAGHGGDYLRWEGRVRAAMQVGEAASSAAGGVLYAWTPRLPFWLQVPVSLAALACAAGTREAPHEPDRHRTSHATAAWHLLRHALWRHARLRTALALHVALSLSTFLMVWLVQPYMQSRGIPVAWFGPIWAAMHLGLAGVSLSSGRIADTFGTAATLFGCCLLVPAGYWLMATTHAIWGVVFYFLLMIVRGLQGPLLATALQRDAPDADRAGVMSLASLCMRLAVAVVGPPIGLLVDRAGLDAALPVVGGAFGLAALAALAAFVRAHGRD
jgi:predicted MFS family arabinose efflux permease